MNMSMSMSTGVATATATTATATATNAASPPPNCASTPTSTSSARSSDGPDCGGFSDSRVAPFMHRHHANTLAPSHPQSLSQSHNQSSVEIPALPHELAFMAVPEAYPPPAAPLQPRAPLRATASSPNLLHHRLHHNYFQQHQQQTPHLLKHEHYQLPRQQRSLADSGKCRSALDLLVLASQLSDDNTSSPPRSMSSMSASTPVLAASSPNLSPSCIASNGTIECSDGDVIDEMSIPPSHHHISHNHHLNQNNTDGAISRGGIVGHHGHLLNSGLHDSDPALSPTATATATATATSTYSPHEAFAFQVLSNKKRAVSPAELVSQQQQQSVREDIVHRVKRQNRTPSPSASSSSSSTCSRRSSRSVTEAVHKNRTSSNTDNNGEKSAMKSNTTSSSPLTSTAATTAATSATPQFRCESCSAVFMRNQDLTRHVASVHERAVVFTCPACPGTRFSRKDALKRHIRTFRCSV